MRIPFTKFCKICSWTVYKGLLILKLFVCVKHSHAQGFVCVMYRVKAYILNHPFIRKNEGKTKDRLLV